MMRKVLVTEVIPTKVTEVAWNGKYIIAKQVDLKKDPKSHNGYEIQMKKAIIFGYWKLKQVK